MQTTTPPRPVRPISADGTTTPTPSGSAPTGPMSPPSGHDQRFLLTRLQREWDRLSVSRPALRTAQGWSLSAGRFDTLDELLRLLGGCRTDAAPGEHGDDAVLGELVRVARTDELAARVLLQRIMPGLSSMTRRRTTTFTEQLDGFADVLTTAWTVIRCFDIERRPNFVAASLVRDVEYRVFRQPFRRKLQLVPVDSADLDRQVVDGDDGHDPRSELAEVLRLAARAGLAESDLHLARRLASGATVLDLAAELQVTDRTIRNRRAALLRRLREVVEAAGPEAA